MADPNKQKIRRPPQPAGDIEPTPRRRGRPRRPVVPPPPRDTPSMGATIAANLARLGWCETVIRMSDVAQAVSARRGKHITRQRISTILNSNYVTPRSVEMIADAIGVTPKELLRPPAES